jgi:hypothetical protein
MPRAAQDKVYGWCINADEKLPDVAGYCSCVVGRVSAGLTPQLWAAEEAKVRATERREAAILPTIMNQPAILASENEARSYCRARIYGVATEDEMRRLGDCTERVAANMRISVSSARTKCDCFNAHLRRSFSSDEIREMTARGASFSDQQIQKSLSIAAEGYNLCQITPPRL